jgi:hypothetical protein
MPRKRRVFSVARELLCKSQEAGLAAIQVFNNPLVKFKSETFIVLMTIAWTYLLHACYRKTGVEYRHHKHRTKRRVFERTKNGSYRHWELRQCLEEPRCPLDNETKKNLLFLLGLRNEIEHHMSPHLDSYLSARYQACCLNYNYYLKQLFGEKCGIDQFMTYSIQFAQLSEEQVTRAEDESIPPNVRAYVARFDKELTAEELNSPKFAYRFLFVRKLAGKPGQADRVIEFVSPSDEIAKAINKEHWVLKEVEKKKYLPGQIVEMMQKEGFAGFNMHHHTELWKKLDGRNPGKGYGVQVARTWYWYERWIDIVRQHCTGNRDKYVEGA